MELKEVVSSEGYEAAVNLFKEYALEIGIDLEFQSFKKEIENVEEEYSRPNGVIFIAYDQNDVMLGCFGIRKLEDTICELKRMYIRKVARGIGIGKQLLMKAIEIGIELGYSQMRLDTLPSMGVAISLYEKAGFHQIDPYRFNPIKGARYYELKFNG